MQTGYAPLRIQPDEHRVIPLAGDIQPPNANGIPARPTVAELRAVSNRRDTEGIAALIRRLTVIELPKDRIRQRPTRQLQI
jgi:hypothetical protein